MWITSGGGQFTCDSMITEGMYHSLEMCLLTVYYLWICVNSMRSTPSTARFPMMTSSNGNIFRVTGHLCGEFTGPRWIPCTKASDAELWCFFDLRPKKLLSKQSWGWWFETPSHPLWRHRNASSSWAFPWHHMSVLMAHITGKSNVCSSAWWGRQRRNH